MREAAGIAVVAALLTLFFFTPRFVIWDGLEVPTAWKYPEVNRAVHALQQLEQPFIEIQSVSNRVIQWRLFFPLVAHALRLPDWAYLALPHLGCLVVLGFVARLLLDQGWRRGETLAAVIVMASGAWFFVSTGWLAYFDSWFVLGLLLVSFSPRRSMLVAAVLIAPWVDERFVFALPISMLVRAEFFQQERKESLRDVLVCGAAFLPWLVMRAGLYWAADDRMTGAYVQSVWERGERLLERLHLEGAWHGLRWGWVLVVAGVFLARRRWVLGVTAASTLVVVFALADDLARGTAVLIPILVLGAACRARLTKLTLSREHVIALAALNLFFPAKHVVATASAPISYLYRELERIDYPPPELDPQELANVAHFQRAQGETAVAREYFDAAIKLDREHVGALWGRAELHLETGNLAAAATDLASALEASPHDPDLLRFAARVFAAAGQRGQAAELLRVALSAAPENWPHRAAVAAELQQMEAATEE